MIAVLGWCDGFGNDTFVVGIFDNVETAQKVCKRSYNDCPTVYVEVETNTEQYFDYDGEDVHRLFNKTKKKKKVSKRG